MNILCCPSIPTLLHFSLRKQILYITYRCPQRITHHLLNQFPRYHTPFSQKTKYCLLSLLARCFEILSLCKGTDIRPLNRQTQPESMVAYRYDIGSFQARIVVKYLSQSRSIGLNKFQPVKHKCESLIPAFRCT